MKQLTIVLLLTILLGCSEQKIEVDLIVKNAIVYTVDAEFSTKQSFAVKDGMFVAVGANDSIAKRYISKELLDANGKVITPGLIDAHCHFYGLGLKQQEVDLTGTASFEEVIKRVQKFQKDNFKDVIIGRGWDQNDWENKEYPTKEELDALYSQTPVVLERIDGHAYLVNQAALDAAGINEETEVTGGEIVKNKAGITGILIDNPMRIIDAALFKKTNTEKIKALKDAEKICLDLGLTTVSDAGLDKSIISLIDSLQQTGDLQIKVYAMISNTKDNLNYYLEKGPYKTNRLNVNAIKVYADGSLGSRGAVLKEPYSDEKKHYGRMVTSISEIKTLADKIATTNFQMNTHAIGDSAIVTVLKAYEGALKGQKNKRWRVEHVQVLEQEDLKYFKKNGIVPSVQPTHATSDMYWAEDRLGKERLKGSYAYKELLRNAGVIALGTDFPVEEVNPLGTFYAAIARKDTKGFPENGFQSDNKLTREEALKGMTIWAAYANFEEKEKGSIEVGKYADFVIMDSDVLQIPEKEILKATILKTYINGKLVSE